MTKVQETRQGWCMLPLTEKKLSEEVDKYFEKCQAENSPPTPSGLALALGVRTSMLSDERLSIIQRNVIDRAMQRIEANTMELMLTRGGVKGMESVLERVEEREDTDRARRQMRRMTDEQIRERLNRLKPKIEEALKEE